MKRIGFVLLVLCGALIVIVTNALGGSSQVHALQDAAAGKSLPVLQLKAKLGSGATVRVTKQLPVFSPALLASVAPVGAAAPQRSASTGSEGHVDFPNLGQSPGSLGCSQRNPGGGSRVNQDCGFQLQAEENIAANPTDPSNLAAGQNDIGAGSNLCGIDWSTDAGRHWGSMMSPYHFKLNNPSGELPTAADPNRNTLFGDPGTLHPYYFASDPDVAFDSRGGAFFSCAIVDVGIPGGTASGLFVAASPPGARGSFYYPLALSTSLVHFSRGNERAYMVVEDNTPRVLHDKPFITADSYRPSPNRDNVYATWTAIISDAQGNFQQEPIYGSMSTDHGVTWSTPEQISGNSPQLCVGGESFDPSLSPSACNFDQGSDPKVLPNGDIAVAYYNQNTPTINNQELAVHCHPTGSSPAGTAHLNCGEPAKVGDAVEAGQPSCAHLGACIPGPYVRTWDVPRLAVNSANGHLYAVWQDYRNGEFDIQMASSTDGGQTWSSTSTVNPDRGLDHFFAAVDIAKRGGRDRVGVSYYRSNRVPNENTTPHGGFAPGQPGVQGEPSDYVLAGGTATATPFSFGVISPVFAPPDGIQAGFLGDYTGITIPTGTQAHPIWSDTRNMDPFAPANGVTHDQDVFTTAAEVPNGVALTGGGTIGQPRLGQGEDESGSASGP